MNGIRRELLTSELGGDGLWHARYPTAKTTLCGLPAAPTTPGRRWPPTCGPCAKTARRFHEIDQSMPTHWLKAA